MTLLVQSAPFSYRGPLRLDITRKSGTIGLFLAPSWDILNPALEARRAAEPLKQRGYALTGMALGRMPTDAEDAERWRLLDEAEAIEAAAWEVYKPLYLAEMRVSVKEKWPRWKELLGRSGVVLVCYCADYTRCHRTVLREEILPKLGARDGGEVR